MNSISTTSPNFGMRIQGLNNPRFQSVPKELINELTTKALQTPNTNYTIEFVPAKNDFIFVKKILDNKSYFVDYFPKGYTPTDIVKTFIKAILPERRVLGKLFRQEANRITAERLYRQNHQIY